MMIAAIVLWLWLTMTIAPATPIARTLRTWMVDRPAARLARITRGHIVLACAATALVLVAGWWLGGDAIRFLAMGTPEFAGWAVAFDIATYADVAVSVALASSTMRAHRWALRFAVAIRRPAVRHRRARKVARPARRTLANDGDDGRGCIAA